MTASMQRALVGTCMVIVVGGQGCDSDDCPDPASGGAVCDVRRACCREHIVQGLGDILGLAPPSGLVFEVVGPEALAQRQVDFRWARNDVADDFLAEVQYRFGHHRQRHESAQDRQIEARQDWVAGTYESSSKTLRLVVPDGEIADGVAAVRVVAHEVVHAYQDELLGLGGGYRQQHTATIDEELAFYSAIEGHATLISTLYMVPVWGIRPASLDLERWASESVARLTEQLEEAEEPWVTKRNGFFYTYGLRLAVRLYEAAGDDAEALEELLFAPPTSTRQLIEPELYGTSAGHPVGIVPADLPASLQEQHLLFADWDMGPWDLALWLVPQLGPTAALDAVAGWRGGLLQVYADEAWAPVFLLTTEWDDEATARVFEQSVSGAYGLGGPTKPRPGVTPDDWMLLQASNAQVTWVQSPNPEDLETLESAAMGASSER